MTYKPQVGDIVQMLSYIPCEDNEDYQCSLCQDRALALGEVRYEYSRLVVRWNNGHAEWETYDSVETLVLRKLGSVL